MTQFAIGALTGATVWHLMLPELKRRARKARRTVKKIRPHRRVHRASTEWRA